MNSFNHNIDLSGNCEFRDFNFSNGSQEMNSKTIISLKEQNASYIGSGAVISNSTNAKNELVINHLSKSAKSDCSFKTVSRGKSNITFSGMVFVDKDCSDTESNQISKGLVMDEEARINLIPMLDINNDDVVCAHGAASGKPVPADQRPAALVRTEQGTNVRHGRARCEALRLPIEPAVAGARV